MSHIRIFKHYVDTHHIVLGVLEFGVLVASTYLGAFLRFQGQLGTEPVTSYEFLPRALLFAGVMSVSMVAMGVYQSRSKEGMVGMSLRTVVSMFLVGGILLSTLFYAFPAVEIYLGRGVLALSSIIGLLLVSVTRVGYFHYLGSEVLKRRVLVVGSGRRARQFAEIIADSGEQKFSVHGYVHWGNTAQQEDFGPLIQLNGSLLNYVEKHNISELVVAVDERRRTDNNGKGFPLEELLDCKLSGVVVSDVLNFIEREIGKIETRFLNPSWLVFADGFGHSAIRDYLERLFDLAASLALLLVAWPFMLLTVVAIKLEEGLRAPIIYGQDRVGYKGKVFKVFKFRSMRVDAEKDGKAVWAQKNDSRVTRVGAFIRNTRIDELPQIFNVLRGDMSFVGPRPERPEFVEQLKKTIPYFDERHRVKPGITGWAQLCYPYGASDEDAEQKLQYDLYYIKNHSLLLDLVIIVQTVEIILIGKGVR